MPRCCVARRQGAAWCSSTSGDIVVHVFHEDERNFYDLERLWRDCPQLDLGVVGTEQTPAAGSAAADAR